MKIKAYEFYKFFIFFIAILLGIVFSESSVSMFIAIGCYFYIGYLVNNKSNVHMMFFLGFTTFIFLPAILNWYYLNINFELYFLSLFIASLFLLLTRSTVVRRFIDYGGLVRMIFIIACLLSVLLLITNNNVIFEFSVAPIIVLLSLSFKQNKLLNNVLYLSVFITIFAIYLLFYWSGFARTVVFGWLLLALLQFGYSIDFNINKYLFGLFPGFGSALIANRDILDLKFSGFEEALYDSAYQPYRLASTFVEYSNQNGIDAKGFWDQIIFTFFVFIPRSVWPDKPYGFGFEYTVQNLDTYLVDAGHSIAATLIGEHLYYLGYFGLITSLIVFLLIAYATNALYNIKNLNGNGTLIFSASMMVLVWGGMSSFSARIALPSIVFVLLFFVLRKLLTGKIKIVWGSKN